MRPPERYQFSQDADFHDTSSFGRLVVARGLLAEVGPRLGKGWTTGPINIKVV